MKLTPAQRRALETVRDGKCFRRYSTKGNTLHGPVGVAASVLWRLEKSHMIRDNQSGPLHQSILILTDAGRKALWHEDGPADARPDAGGAA